MLTPIDEGTLPDFYASEDPLIAFLDWFIESSPKFGLIPLHNAVHMIEDVVSVTWFRHKQFQVQLFVVPPNYIIPEHTHPNVDSYEVYLGGQAKFSLDGVWKVSEKQLVLPAVNGVSPMREGAIRVLPDALHGGPFGPSGGVFMSVQHWLNGVKPHCVSADYSGQVMGPHHFDGVQHGDAISAEQSALNFKDAASKVKKGAYWDLNIKDRVAGRVESADEHQVCGWVVDKTDKASPAVVEVHYNNRLVGVGLSSQYRADIEKKMPKTRGIAGYSIKIMQSEIIGDFQPALLEVKCHGAVLPAIKGVKKVLSLPE